MIVGLHMKFSSSALFYALELYIMAVSIYASYQ